MKLCVSAWSVQEKLFPNKMSLIDFLELCHENGVEYVELLDCFFNSEEQIAEVIDKIDELSIKVGAFSIGNDFVQTDSEERKKQVDAVKAGIDMACRLNTPLLRVFSGDVKQGIDFDMASGWIVECFKEAALYAQEKEITMVLENHGLLAGKSEQIKGIIDTVGSQYLKSNADVGNFLLVDENPLEAVENLEKYIGFVHFKDFRRVGDDEVGYASISNKKYQGCILGTGDVPMKEIVDYLYEKGYKGYLSIEYEGVGDPIEETVASIEFVRSVIRD